MPRCGRRKKWGKSWEKCWKLVGKHVFLGEKPEKTVENSARSWKDEMFLQF
jgi:hypothetical protein